MREAFPGGSGPGARRGSGAPAGLLVPVLSAAPAPLGDPVAGGRVSVCPSPGAGEQHRFNLAFMCHRVRERLLRAAGTPNTCTAAPRAEGAELHWPGLA